MRAMLFLLALILSLATSSIALAVSNATCDPSDCSCNRDACLCDPSDCACTGTCNPFDGVFAIMTQPAFDPLYGRAEQQLPWVPYRA